MKTPCVPYSCPGHPNGLSVFNHRGTSYLTVNTAWKSAVTIWKNGHYEEELSSLLEKLHRVGRAESLCGMLSA